MSTKTLIEHMNIMLADTYVVLMKTQNVHWNYVGSNFYGMHKMTEEQYLDMFEAVDKIAERIRAKGHNAPSGLSEYTSLSEYQVQKIQLSSTVTQCVSILSMPTKRCATPLRDT